MTAHRKARTRSGLDPRLSTGGDSVAIGTDAEVGSVTNTAIPTTLNTEKTSSTASESKYALTFFWLRHFASIKL
jgi:hypothetical protein